MVSYLKENLINSNIWLKKDTPLYLRDTFVTFFTNPFDLKTGQVIIVIVILTLVVTFIMSIINAYWGDSKNE